MLPAIIAESVIQTFLFQWHFYPSENLLYCMVNAVKALVVWKSIFVSTCVPRDNIAYVAQEVPATKLRYLYFM